MTETKSAGEKLQRLRLRYAKQLPDLQEKVESGWKSLLDSHWGTSTIENFLNTVHRIAGSSSSYGYQQINTTAKMVETTLREILDNPIGATSEFQERLETQLDMLRAAFEEDQQPTPADISIREEDVSLRGVRSNHRIYLVEDDPLQAEEIAEQISYFGYAVTSFTSLNDLVEAIKKQPPAVILMDVIFPEGLTAGPEAVIRLQQETDDLAPVIFISERGTMNSRLQAVRAGGEAYFIKPVEIGALVEVLDQLTVDEKRDICRVLIVDEVEEQAIITAEHLKKFGMETIIVTNPMEINEPLDDFQPNVILLDAYMACCSGPELAKVIRQIEKHMITPIIYLSSEEDRQKELDLLISDSEDFIPKTIGAERLKNIVQSRIERFRQLRSLMVRDSLTGLYNHTAIKERIDQELSRASRQKTPLSFAMIDLDHFKQVNDTYGHGAGDRVLKSMARYLTQRLRKTDVIGRYGGEEFAVILPDTPLKAAIRLLNELRTGFARIHHRGGNTDFTVELSAGVSAFPEYGNPTALIEAADEALYSAKDQGRNRVVAAGESVN